VVVLLVVAGLGTFVWRAAMRSQRAIPSSAP
jgi:hypothetical protein